MTTSLRGKAAASIKSQLWSSSLHVVSMWLSKYNVSYKIRAGPLPFETQQHDASEGMTLRVWILFFFLRADANPHEVCTSYFSDCAVSCGRLAV